MLPTEHSEMNLSEADQFPELIEGFFHDSPLGFFVLDQNGLILRVNRIATRLLGLEPEGLANKSLSRYIAPESQKELYHFINFLIESGCTECQQFRLLQRYKPLTQIKVMGRAFFITKSNLFRIIFVIVKTSHPNKSDDESGNRPEDHFMVNELNQPLSVIANYIYGCIYRIECGNYKITNVLQAMKQAEQELHRTAEMIMRIKNFSCKEVFHYEPVSINVVINEVIPIINHEIVHFPVHIEYRPAKGLPEILLDKLHFQQAILNLSRNAIDALRDSDRVDPRLIIEINRQSIKTLEIRFSDNGPAFRPGSVHKLFEPGYTTKPYGIGLGLIMARLIIEAHDGKLFGGLNPAGGACFNIELPIRSAET